MLKTTLIAAVLLTAGPVLAQDASPASEELEATFTWTGVDAGPILPMGDGQEAYMAEHYLVISATDGPLAGLAWRCLVTGLADLKTNAEHNSGTCVYMDANGDQLWERIGGATEGDGAPFVGQATWIGGTGRFEDASGEMTDDTSFSASPRSGVYQRTGVKRGTLTLTGS